MKVEESNKLIAEFMGKSLQKSNFWSSVLGYADEFIIINGKPKWSLSDIPYNLDWNWLMPVVDKIESISKNEECAYNVQIEQCFCTIVENHNSNEIVDVDADTKIEAVYKAVVEFINWYNKQNKNGN